MRPDHGPTVYAMPVHRAFADALAAGIIARYGSDPTGLARGIVLLPSNRAKLAVQSAFVRASGGGLLMPRLVTIGDAELDERVGLALDTLADEDPLPPAIDPLRRRLILARLVGDDYRARALSLDDATAMRLADALARALDQLHFEQVAPARLADLPLADELAEHWQASFDHFKLLLDAWPKALAATGCMDMAARRNVLLDRVSASWAAKPPARFVVAAGVTTGAPAIARLLRTVADLADGCVVLPGLDLSADDAQWDALGPMDAADAGEVRPAPRLETHPQYHLKLLLHRMGISRAEVQIWDGTSEFDGPDSRDAFISRLFAPAAFTGQWQALTTREKALPGAQSFTFATSADEAQGIALMLRATLDVPGQTAALVTPDRALAARVAAALARWGLSVDDSAGQPLASTAPGTLAVLMAEAAAGCFTPVNLVALLKHPLVRRDEGRADWLDAVRLLDKVLRVPGAAPGLAGITAFITKLANEPDGRGARDARAVLPWWKVTADVLAPAQAMLGGASAQPLAALVAVLRNMLSELAADAIWQGEAGRALADTITRLEGFAGDGPALIRPADFPAILRDILTGVPVRPPFGGHPRLFIWGLVEAQLQRAGRMILAGLNEGKWPQAPSPDPWLAPGLRKALGLPSLDRASGLSAQDFALALGARDVVLTRADRDGSDPAVASRFWLRLSAMRGDMPGVAKDAPDFAVLAAALDTPPGRETPVDRPKPAPPVAERKRKISVTTVDMLAKDPYSYYAKDVLRLSVLDPIAARPTPAWRGTRVHALMEEWVGSDKADPAKLEARLQALRDDPALDPVARALWLPRIEPAIRWAAAEVVRGIAEGRTVAAQEVDGKAEVAGVTLKGKADRVDRLPDGSLAIVDYKTGGVPNAAAVARGDDRQLGLLGLLGERGAMKGVDPAEATGFEYWQLTPDRKAGTQGRVKSPVGGRSKLSADAIVDLCLEGFEDLVDRYLLGDAPYIPGTSRAALARPEMQHLMRMEEWFGREPDAPDDHVAGGHVASGDV